MLGELGLTADHIAAIFLNSVKKEVVLAHVDGSFDIDTKKQLVIPRMDLPALMTWSNIVEKDAMFFDVDGVDQADTFLWSKVADQLVGLRDKYGNQVTELFCAGYGFRTTKQFVKIGKQIVDMTPDNGVVGIGSVRYDKVNGGLVAVGLDQKFRGIKILTANLDVLNNVGWVVDIDRWDVIAETKDAVRSLSRVQTKDGEMKFHINLVDQGYQVPVTIVAKNGTPNVEFGPKYRTPVTLIGAVNTWDNIYAGFYNTPDHIGIVLEAVPVTEQPFVHLTLDL